MEVGGSSAGSSTRSGEGDLCAAQESREEEKARSGGGAMRARVCARVRTPHGVGALLLVGGAIVGAAVVAWRRRGDGKGANHHQHREKQPAKEEGFLDGGVVEDEQIQGKFDQSDENSSREDTEDGKETHDLHENQEEEKKEEEINADKLDSKLVEKFDPNSSRGLAEIVTVDTVSSAFCTNKESGDVNKADQNSRKNDIEEEVMPNAIEGVESVENCDQSTLTISSLEIAREEHNDGPQETASTQATAPQLLISEEAKADTMAETAEVELAEGTAIEENVSEHEAAEAELSKGTTVEENVSEQEAAEEELAKGTTMEENVSEHEEHKQAAEKPAVAAVIDSSVISSPQYLLKSAEKKRPANPEWKESGMKLYQDQDCGNGELSKVGTKQGGVAVVTVDRRAASMAVLAIILAVTIGVNAIFAVTIGVNIISCLYSHLRGT
ncbi:uncharacterized protein LOC104584376 isoform X2 [Brachypodium distachyon]|uniref:uncharacterized protein LOC104584376 isoform X2 n=1 Tax=Brachypodium distachyon TaxID=15368 RepID=UPI000D0D3903|nr:uncharacterized protein LOC104584376 isoform X2 [Brachypodium distachyon]|eukprot:XP_024310235.1 uncharacterized protein LOC104584376 isoform X2 [Brachypodium distachyon]